MTGRSYWIWHYGDYELFHNMKLHMRREEYGMNVPAFFKIDRPHLNIKFKKSFRTDFDGYMTVYLNGIGRINLDGHFYAPEARINVPSGEHTVEVSVANESGFPSIFVESDVCPSDKTWLSSHIAGHFCPVGGDEAFDSADCRVEKFPFEYEEKSPITTEELCDGVLFDFGEELLARLLIDNADENAELCVIYGESREEALDREEAIILESVSGRASYCLKARAFRYVCVIGANSDISARAEHEYLPLEQRGSFECSNELYNKIVDASVRTFHLNCREAFLDGIKRDRWVWSGDAYQSARINEYLFADEAIVRRTALGLMGRAPFEAHLNGIVDYSFYFIIGLWEYYMAYGDRDFLERMYPRALEVIRFSEGRVNADGFITECEGDWVFVDWADMDKTGAVCAEQFLFAESYRVMADIAALVGQNGEEFRYKYDALRERIDRFYWREHLGAYIDSYESGKESVTRHANIFAVMYGFVSPERAQIINENVFENDAVPKITTPYFKGYELDVYGKLGRLDKIERELDTYWGGMIALGAGTVWEEFDPSMNGIEHYAMYGGKFMKSLCHAWGAGPIYLFGRYYLGVYPTSPGYESFNVEPCLGGLDSMSGTVYAAGANVRLSLDKNSLTVSAERDGGTLIFRGERYPIKKNSPVILELNGMS